MFTQYVIIPTLFGYIRWGYPFYIDFLESKKKYKRRERERERSRKYVVLERYYDITKVSSDYTKESLSFFFAKLWLIIVHTYVEMQIKLYEKK